MSDDEALHCSLRVQDFPETTFQVFRFEGTEAISRLFRFDIATLSDRQDLDLTALLGKSATLTITVGAATRTVHGMIGEVVQEGATATDEAIYHLVLEPRLADLGRSRQSQIYGPDDAMGIAEILEAELLGRKAVGPTRSAVPRLAADDVDINLKRGYPNRDYVVQYQESDLDFIARLMEHLGIFYYFDHQGSDDVLMISDDNVRCAPLPSGPDTVPYRPASGLLRPEDLAVSALTCRTQRLPKTLILRDYDHRKPDVDLTVETTVDAAGHGVVISYGNKVQSLEESQELASIRAEELQCRRQTFSGTSNHPGFCPGFVFTLEDHYRSDFNQAYLLVEVHARCELWRPQRAGASDPTAPRRGADSGYRNRFVAVPSSVRFRPERRTPQPKATGLVNAMVEAQAPSERADLDADGYYRLRTLFDLSGRAAGQASKAIRKAEPYAGANRGQHFPVAAGTEVLCAHLDGDPDRPVILGCVPNADNPSVVNSTNHLRNRIRTAAGITLDMNDGDGQTGLASAAEIPDLGTHGSDASPTSLGAAAAPADASAAAPRPRRIAIDALPSPPPAAPPYRRAADDPPARCVGAAATPSSASDGGGGGDGADATFFRLYVPDEAAAGASETYLRFGSAAGEVEDAGFAAFEARNAATAEQRFGWLDYTDAGHVSLANTRCTATLGNERHDTVGDQSITVQGAQTVAVTGKRTVTVGTAEAASNQDTTVQGDRSLTVKGADTATIDGDRSLTVAGKETTTVGSRSDTVKGSETRSIEGTVTHTGNQSYTLKLAGSLTIEAADITLKSTSGSLSLTAATTLALSAGSDLSAQAGTTLALDAGSNLTGTANMAVEFSGASQFKASGGSTAELSGGASATVKGALVKLN